MPRCQTTECFLGRLCFGFGFGAAGARRDVEERRGTRRRSEAIKHNRRRHHQREHRILFCSSFVPRLGRLAISGLIDRQARLIRHTQRLLIRYRVDPSVSVHSYPKFKQAKKDIASRWVSAFQSCSQASSARRRCVSSRSNQSKGGSPTTSDDGRESKIRDQEG